MKLGKDCCVAVFGYNRPSHLRRVLIALESYKLKKIYFFLDGAKNKHDKINQKEILLMTAQNPYIKVNIVKASKNLGLKLSIENGLKKLSKNYKFAIILEDDCVPRKNFFEFIRLNLKYFNSEKFAAICGYLYNPIHKKYSKNEDTFSIEFTNFCPWGYCIDLRIWSNYIKTKLDKNNAKISKDIIFKNIEKISNPKNIWTLGFMKFCRIKEYSFLYPSISLIKNIGFDGSGQNSKITDKFDTKYHHSKISKKIYLFSKGLNEVHKKFLKNNIKYFY